MKKSIYSVAKALIILFLLAFVLHIVASVLCDWPIALSFSSEIISDNDNVESFLNKKMSLLNTNFEYIGTQQTISTCLILPCHFLGILPPYQVTFPWEQMPISYVLFILIVIKIDSIM